MYPIFAGQPCKLGGLLPVNPSLHCPIHVLVKDSGWVKWWCTRCRNTALHFASILTRFQPPYRFGRYNVDSGSQKISPSHRKRELVICSWTVTRVKCMVMNFVTSTFRNWQHKNICLFPYTNSRMYKERRNNAVFLFVIWIEQRKRMKAFIGL
jgi:hypothetical protein